MAARAASMIERWGGPAQLLRNGTTLRDCTAAVLDFTPHGEGLGLRGTKRALIAAPLAIPPDHEQDELIHNGERYAIVQPVKGPRPAVSVIYYDAELAYRATYP
jgi:hypothetical protein